MPATHNLQRTVLLPKRLADDVVGIAPGNCFKEVASRPNTFGLTERIEALPGIKVEHALLPDNTLTTDHFIEGAYILRDARTAPHLLCHIDNDGILIPDMSPLDTEQVMRKGWASCVDEAVVLFLPRDDIEMEVSWRIVLLAYQFLTSPQSGARRKGQARLPHCSSWAKYWL